jgi:hypothetical protein
MGAEDKNGNEQHDSARKENGFQDALVQELHGDFLIMLRPGTGLE